MATNQGELIAALQEALGAGYEDYSLEGLWHAYLDGESVAAGPLNQRLLTWLNTYLGTSHENLPRVMQLYAESLGYYNWPSIVQWTLSTGPGLGDDGNPTPDPEQELDDETSIGVTSDTGTFAADTTSGNAIVVAIAIKGTTEVDTITDNQSNIYARIGRVLDTDVATEMWAAYGITGGATTITITYSAATNAGWSALEITGVKNNNAIDYSSYVENTGGGGSSNPATVTGNTPAAANNLWLASLSLGGGGSAAGITTPTGWAEFSTHQDYDAYAAGQATWKDDETGEAQTASWSNNTTTANYAAMIVALKNVDAAITSVDGEGEIAAIATRDGTDSIFLNPNDTTSMTKPRNAVYLASSQWPVPGDEVDLRFSKAQLGGLTGESYLDTVATNRINNGSFDSSDGWSLTGGATISGGTLNFNGAACTAYRALDDTTGMNIGTGGDFARIQFTITEYNSGTLTVRIGAGSYANVPQATGTYITWDTCTGAAGPSFVASDFDGKIDNVEVKHVPGPIAYHSSGSYNTLTYDYDRSLYGVIHANSQWCEFRPALTTTTALQDFEYYIVRDITLGDVQAIWIADGGDYFDIYQDGSTSSILDAGVSYSAILIDDVDQGTPDRNAVHDVLKASQVTITNYRDVDFTTVIEEADLRFGDGYTAGSDYDPVGCIDYGLLIRPNDQKQMNNGERRRVYDWYENLISVKDTDLKATWVRAQVAYEPDDFNTTSEVSWMQTDVIYVPSDYNTTSEVSWMQVDVIYNE